MVLPGTAGRSHVVLFSRLKTFLSISLVVLVAQALAWGQTATTAPLAAGVDGERVARLRSHGLAPTADLLLNFLKFGFAPGTQLSDLPPQPTLKTQIVVDAIVELARLRSTDALPVLVQLAQGSLPAGVGTILDWDAAQQRHAERARFRAGVIKKLRLNAIVAIGLIGGPDDAYLLIPIFEAEKDPDLKIPCALALATMGSRAGLPYLLREVRRANRTTSVAAGRALKFITGHDYGPAADDPISRRKAAAADWKNWWRKNGKTFRPDREQILARRLAPSVRPLPREPRTVRDLVDCIAFPRDPRWTIDSYEAFERLSTMGGEALAGLEKIIADKDESLTVRRRAILLYTQIVTAASGPAATGRGQRRNAYKTLRRIRWDRNPEIREVVRKCLKRLK